MSRRKKSKPVKTPSKKSVYLTDEYQILVDALDKEFGDDLDDENYCKKKKKGKKMTLKLPGTISGDYSTGTGGQWNNWQGSTNSHQHEHKGDKIVWESKDGTKKLYAGNGRGVNEYSGAWDLIIDLAGNIHKTVYYGFVREISAKRFDALRKMQGTYSGKVKSELLSLDWPDMRAPNHCKLDFWTTLYDMLPEKTVMMCVGGHGRTGTCLASLMIASGEMTYYEAVPHVRKEHCDRAIENKEQEEYLHKLYMERVEKEIEWWQGEGAEEKEAAQYLKAAQDALQYAKDHVPGHGTKKVRPIEKIALASFRPTEQEIDAIVDGPAHRYKLVGIIPYKLRCMDKDCRVHECKIRVHQDWTIWDVGAAAASMH